MKESVYKHALLVTTILGAIAAAPLVGHAEEQVGQEAPTSENSPAIPKVTSTPVTNAPQQAQAPEQTVAEPSKTTAPITKPAELTPPDVTAEQPIGSQPPPVVETPAEVEVPAPPAVTQPPVQDEAQKVEPVQEEPAKVAPITTPKVPAVNTVDKTTVKPPVVALKKAAVSVTVKKEVPVVKAQAKVAPVVVKAVKKAAAKSYGSSIKDTFKDSNLSKAVVALLVEELEEVNGTPIDDSTIFTQEMAEYINSATFDEAGISNIGATRFLVKS